MNQNHKSRGSIVGFLIRSYILFTLLVVLAGVLTVTVFLFLASSDLLKWSDNNPGKYVDLLSEEDYDEFPAEQIFGHRGAFLILDENHQELYRSDEELQLSYTPEELSIIPAFDKDVEVRIETYQDDEDRRIVVVTKKRTPAEGQETKIMTVFDEDFHVLFTSDRLPLETLTRQEFDLYSMRPTDELITTRYDFTTADGSPRTMLIRSDSLEEIYNQKINTAFTWILGIFAVEYILLILLFVVVINRKIKKPLRLLQQAMIRFPDEHGEMNISYSGPKEFVRIFDHFDRMSQCLSITEQENKALQEQKQSMLADISHDLKTPITVIQGYARALHDGLMEESQRDAYLDAIYHKSELLTQLINAFSEYNKLEHPTYEIHPVPTDVCEYARQYLSEKYDEIETAGFQLQVEIPETPLKYSLDAFQFRRILDNLISNAFRHNPRGTTILFEVSKRAEGICLTVADDGVGVPPELAPRIFEPFTVGNASRTRDGTGLGLSIARKIVLLHGGTISLRIPPREGYSTEFEILLPDN